MLDHILSASNGSMFCIDGGGREWEMGIVFIRLHSYFVVGILTSLSAFISFRFGMMQPVRCYSLLVHVMEVSSHWLVIIAIQIMLTGN